MRLIRGVSDSTAIGINASFLSVFNGFFRDLFGLKAVEDVSTASQIILGLRSEYIVKLCRNALLGAPRKNGYIFRQIM